MSGPKMASSRWASSLGDHDHQISEIHLLGATLGHDTFAVLIMFQSSSKINDITDGLISKGAKHFRTLQNHHFHDHKSLFRKSVHEIEGLKKWTTANSLPSTKTSKAQRMYNPARLPIACIVKGNLKKALLTAVLWKAWKEEQSNS